MSPVIVIEVPGDLLSMLQRDVFAYVWPVDFAGLIFSSVSS